MKFRAFGRSLLVAENKGGSEVGGIKIASFGKLKSGKVLSVGKSAKWEWETDEEMAGREIVYIAEKAMPFEFGEPGIVVVNIDDIVADELEEIVE